MLTRMLKVALVALVVPLCAYAQIGETVAQCKARFGEEQKSPWDFVLTFNKGDMGISVELYAGKVELITYQKGGAAALSDAETEGLLKENGGDKKWGQGLASEKETQLETEGGLLVASRWETEDGALVASRSLNRQSGAVVLCIAQKGWLESKERTRREAEEKKRLKGL